MRAIEHKSGIMAVLNEGHWMSNDKRLEKWLNDTSAILLQTWEPADGDPERIVFGKVSKMLSSFEATDTTKENTELIY